MGEDTLCQQLMLHRRKLTSGKWGLYLHGTAAPFDCIDATYFGRGGDTNSSLGFFVTPSPEQAVRYAQEAAKTTGKGTGAVLLCLVKEARPYEFDTFESFFGTAWSGEPGLRTKRDFVKLRNSLVAKKHDLGWFALDDDGPIGVVLHPSYGIILGALTLEQTLKLQATLENDGRGETDLLRAVCQERLLPPLQKAA